MLQFMIIKLAPLELSLPHFRLILMRRYTMFLHAVSMPILYRLRVFGARVVVVEGFGGGGFR